MHESHAQDRANGQFPDGTADGAREECTIVVARQKRCSNIAPTCSSARADHPRAETQMLRGRLEPESLLGADSSELRREVHLS